MKKFLPSLTIGILAKIKESLNIKSLKLNIKPKIYYYFQKIILRKWRSNLGVIERIKILFHGSGVHKTAHNQGDVDKALCCIFLLGQTTGEETFRVGVNPDFSVRVAKLIDGYEGGRGLDKLKTELRSFMEPREYSQAIGSYFCNVLSPKLRPIFDEKFIRFAAKQKEDIWTSKTMKTVKVHLLKLPIDSLEVTYTLMKYFQHVTSLEYKVVGGMKKAQIGSLVKMHYQLFYGILTYNPKLGPEGFTEYLALTVKFLKNLFLNIDAIIS